MKEILTVGGNRGYESGIVCDRLARRVSVTALLLIVLAVEMKNTQSPQSPTDSIITDYLEVHSLL